MINTKTLWLETKHEHMHKCPDCGHIWKHDANKEVRELAEKAKSANMTEMLKSLKWLLDNEQRMDYEYERAHVCENCRKAQHDIYYPQGVDYSLHIKHEVEDWKWRRDWWEQVYNRMWEVVP